MNGGDLVARVLADRDVPALFTLCGGHISPILVAAKARGVRVIDTRHEASAVFAADAAARLTGIPGVAAVTAGPGVTNAMTAIENARLAQSPVVVIGGATATALRGRGALQDIDQLSLIASRLKWYASAKTVRDLGPLTARAMDEAAGGVPGPVFLEIPVDLLYPEDIVRGWYGEKSGGGGRSIAARATRWYLKRHVDKVFGGDPREVPAAIAPVHDLSKNAVANAAERLGSADRPVLLVGSQATLGTAHATASAIERLGVPTYLGGMARGLLGRDSPLQMRHKRRDALKEADLVVLAGLPFDFRLDYGRSVPRTTPVISINRDRADLRRNRRPTLGVQGDPGAFLRSLAEHARPRERDDWFATLRARDDAREADLDERAASDHEHGVDPLALLRTVDRVAADDAILVADGGDFVATAAYSMRPRGPLGWLDPGPFGTLGVGGGFALGVAAVRPGRELWILYGDGSAGYSIAEFDTYVRHGFTPIALVGNDACWAQIAREQVEILGDDVGCALLETDYDRVAAGFGGVGLKIETRAEIEGALREARRVAAEDGKPVLVNAVLAKTDFRKGSISI